jgi:hypothetical protein
VVKYLAGELVKGERERERERETEREEEERGTKAKGRGGREGGRERLAEW